MAGQNLKQLLEEAKKAMREHQGQDYSLQLIETLVQDHCWEAKSVENTSDIENPNIVTIVGFGNTPEEALDMLIGELTVEKQTLDQHKSMYEEDLLWGDIGDLADQHSNMIELPTLRKILEKYNILKQEKGM